MNRQAFDAIEENSWSLRTFFFDWSPLPEEPEYSLQIQKDKKKVTSAIFMPAKLLNFSYLWVINAIFFSIFEETIVARKAIFYLNREMFSCLFDHQKFF